MMQTGQFRAAPNQQSSSITKTETEGAQLEKELEVLANLAERTLGNSKELDATIFGATPESDKPSGAPPYRNGVVLQALDRVRQVIHTLEVASQQLSDTNQRLH